MATCVDSNGVQRGRSSTLGGGRTLQSPSGHSCRTGNRLPDAHRRPTAVFEHAVIVGGHESGRLAKARRPDIRIERETPATMLIEADRAFGPVVTTYAMKQAIANARGCPGYTTARSPSPYREAGIASSPWIWPPAWLPSASWKWPWTGASPSLTRGRLTRTANRPPPGPVPAPGYKGYGLARMPFKPDGRKPPVDRRHHGSRRPARRAEQFHRRHRYRRVHRSGGIPGTYPFGAAAPGRTPR